MIIPKKKLSVYQKLIFDEFIEFTITSESPVNVPLIITDYTRNRVRLAEGLLYRDDPEDCNLAARILKEILDLQYKNPIHPFYGSWKTSPEFVHLDMNWREFVGCDLIIILHYYQEKLPPDLVSGIKTALIRAARGAKIRNVPASYSNISLMSAFLMDWVGQTYGKHGLIAAGRRKAAQVYKLFKKFDTFSEYNSPTYAGVSMIALALWRELGISDGFKSRGAEMEEILWKDRCNFYHAEMKNLSGPHFRGYGMDMTKYNAILGIWLAVAVDNEEIAPLPRYPGKKNLELSNIVPILHLGLIIPEIAKVNLNNFTHPRLITQKVIGGRYFAWEKAKTVTAMMTQNWMMGGVKGYKKAYDQCKAGTIYWKIANSEDLGWILVPAHRKSDIVVNQTSLQIHCRNKMKKLVFYIQGDGIEKAMLSGSQWILPGIKLNIKSEFLPFSIVSINPTEFQKTQKIVEDLSNILEISIRLTPHRNYKKPVIEISPIKEF